MEDYLEEMNQYEVLHHITQNFINIENEKKTREDVGKKIDQFKNIQKKKTKFYKRGM